MESLRFEGNTIDQCIKKASDTLKIPVENINYTILEEKKGLFRKKAVISVQHNIVCEDKNNGTVAIVDGKIIVNNPKENGKPAVVIPGQNVKLIIDGEEVSSRCEVFEKNAIEVFFDENEAKRHLDIQISPDGMESHVNIDYHPQIIYDLQDVEENCSITIEGTVKDEIYPPIFTKQEIYDELSKIGIKYGIIEENLIKCVEERKINNLLIAKGLQHEDDTDDFLELKFNKSDVVEGLFEDEKGRVDYKNVGSVRAIGKGEIIAIKHDGHDGHDGMNVFGNVVKKKTRKIINLRVGEGCFLKDSNTVLSAIPGKPCIKNGTFYVYEVHEVQEDVDIKTGNIKFIGDVKIYGNVKDGMLVEAGNTIDVEKNVENARLEAKGNIEIKGNVISSTLTAGGQDVKILSYIEKMKELKLSLDNMVDTIMEIKKFSLLGQKATDGEIIKTLMENKFKNVIKLCFNIISLSKLAGVSYTNQVVQTVREKLIGIAPLEIKHFSELDSIVECLDKEIEDMQSLISLPVNVKVFYAQDSTINSSGDIYITGKGQYVSTLTAHGSIYFLTDRSIARGGSLKARNELRCKTVGSVGGVATRLEVDERGHIWIDEAYQNTLLIVGHKEFTLETPSKNIHTYLNHKGDLIVDRLNL